MKAFFFIAIILMPEKAFPRTPTINERVVDIAGIFVGVMEQGVNRHPFIDEWNRRLGVPLGSSYCATFISFILDSARATAPHVRSGVAQRFITQSSVRAERVMSGQVTIPAGSVVIWRRGDTWMGHVGITERQWTGSRGYTIEGNTSPGTTGSQSNGNGIWRRTRTINPTAYFRITNFTHVH